MDNQTIAKRYKTELSSVKDLLFKFLLGWTAVLFVFSWLDFLIPRLEVSDAMVTSYLILLGVYIIHKETSRWTGVKLNIRHNPQRNIYPMDRGQIEYTSRRIVCICVVDFFVGDAYHKFLHQFGSIPAHKVPGL